MDVISSGLGSFEGVSPQSMRHILSYLGVRDLLNCCCLNWTWWAMVSSCEDIWFRACQEIGLVAEDNGTRTPGQWKKLVIEMIARKRRMLSDSPCFAGSDLKPRAVVVRAIHYHNEKIAVAADKKIMLCNLQNVCLHTLWLTWEPAFVKLTDHFLFAASDTGTMVCWETEASISVFHRRDSAMILVSYDILDSSAILAAGFEDNSLVVWSILFGDLVLNFTNHTSVIEKIMLAPERTRGRLCSLWLFTVDNDFIFVRLISYINHGRFTDEFSARRISTIPLHPNEESTVQRERSTTPSLLFHGGLLYFINEKNVVCRWDVMRDYMLSETRLDASVKTLLDVGNKYLAFIGTEKDGANHYFLAIDKETEEIVARCDVTEVVCKSPARVHNCLCIGDRRWLDGLDGENDSGMVLACARMDMPPYVLQWTPRSN